MAWWRTGDDPLFELMNAWFTDAYMCHYDIICGVLKELDPTNNDNLSSVPDKKHYSYVIMSTMASQKWAWWRLKSRASRFFTQPFVQAQIKGNIKALRLWPLWGESTGNQWIPLREGQ